MSLLLILIGILFIYDAPRWTLLQVKTVIYLALNYVTVVSNRGINLPNELAEMNTMLYVRREKAGNSILWSFLILEKITDFHRVKIR